MSLTFHSVAPLPGDTVPVLYAKILQSVGGIPEPGDSPVDSLRKILVVRDGGVGLNTFGDSKRYLLFRWALTEGETPSLPEQTVGFLRKILIALGGTPLPDDSEHNLLSKILTALGVE